MTTLARTLIALLIVVAANCGAGTDGKSVAPPTTPQVAPEPPPEAPGQPTGIRVVEVGQTFIVWAWDPVEGATGYQAEVFLAGLPPGQRGDPIITEEPTVRADDLEPRTEMEIFVRAVRETAGGRAVGPWSANSPVAQTLPEPLVCTDERERATTFSPVLLPKWDGTPFRVDMIRNFPESVTEDDLVQLLAPVGLLADKIERQLGYRILEMGDLIPVPVGVPPGWNEDEAAFRRNCPLPRERGQIQGFYMDDTNGGAPTARAQGNVRCESFSYLSPGLGPGRWPCPGCYLDGVTLHEIFHVLGFVHDDDYDFLARGEGVAMSNALTRGGGRDAEAVLWSDIDLLRCIFPKQG